MAEWPHSGRSSYNCVFIKIEGVDTDFRFLDRTESLNFLIKNLPPGTTISVYVIAANEGGEAVPSPTVTKVGGKLRNDECRMANDGGGGAGFARRASGGLRLFLQ